MFQWINLEFFFKWADLEKISSKNLTTDIFGSCQGYQHTIIAGASPDKTHTKYK
jgi:hypothetical protein